MKPQDNRKSIGAIIKSLRTQKQLSQKELCKSGTLDQICTVRHLMRIEKGTHSPYPEVLNRLLSVLGVNIAEFQALLYDNDLRQFNNDFEEIWSAGFVNNHQAYNSKLEELKDKDYCNTSIPSITQALMLLEANAAFKVTQDHNVVLDMLYEALRITTSKVLSKDNIVNCQKVNEPNFTINEYRIIKLMAVVKAKLGQPEEAIEINEALIASLKRSSICYNTRNKLMATVYFNLSNNLLSKDRYDEAFGVIEEGIAFCEKAKEYKVIGELRYNKARFYYLTGDMEQAKIHFKESYDTFTTLMEHKNAEYVKLTAKNKYSIEIGESS
ncbi:MAG: helix-turn-helix transcriptional regulator [Firmicutes bacterium]|nr:helix-turn-helix transcriptional regulator [Bacillota bacterium]